ncbi:MAG: exodeoxyribonuclease VII large subunit [Parcubacteria group bacterium CG23_combo_of_CG06-09_8_20_14_all_35_9]|nr:MAG: exodeoxyribonuclease VII large subunit [Parcubacteria group bacterium CG23_combo_of_CG06-09_8_20_14_all_35_9]
MDKELLQKLKDWRRIVAQSEGVEIFRVLSNKTIKNIATLKPCTKDELLVIKGIKEKRFEKYGKDILALVNIAKCRSTAISSQAKLFSGVNGDQNNIGSVLTPRISENVDKDEKPYTVSSYLSLLNSKLGEQRARIQGEISSLDIRENYLFFSLKDKDNESILNCFMWESNYRRCGILFKEGIEVIIEGFPEVYKPNGRLTFRTSIAELVGEGVLKKAYEQLKKKLESEGLFAEERKKPIPEFPQKIGLITSETGAVIHDFLNNLGKYGYQIKFVGSRVEGQAAVRSLLLAINCFDGKDIDVLVIIRGGGSLESLQAFNNEALVRKIASLDVPVICGIGHDKDIPLVSLTSDSMASTPTAVAVALNKSWERALSDIRIFEQIIINKYQKALADRKYQLEILTRKLRQGSDFIFRRFETIKRQLSNKLMTLGYNLKDTNKILDSSSNLLLANFQNNLDWIGDYLNRVEGRLKIADPMRQLKLGYSIALAMGKIVRSVKQVKQGDRVDIQVSDGKIKSQVKNIINK